MGIYARLFRKKRVCFLETFPSVMKVDDNLLRKIDRIIDIKKEVNKAIEIARNEKIVGHPLDARVELYIDESDLAYCKIDEGLEKVFIVSELYVDNIDNSPSDVYTSDDGNVKVKVSASKLPKCERCWVHSETIGESKEHPALCRRCVENL